MHLFNCPICLKEHDVTDELPSDAWKDVDYECDHCGAELEIGWYAVVEVRNVKLTKEPS